MISAKTSSLSITLYRGFPDTGIYTWSPFVTKLEARLRFANIVYTPEAGSIFKPPRGKLPYISLSSLEVATPTVLPDSALIVHRLVEDNVLPNLNEKLSPVDRARDLTIRALLEDKLYFVQIYERWNDNYYTMRSKVLAALPYPVQIAVGFLAHRGVMRTLHGQGIARYTDEERAALRLEVWDNVNAVAAEARRGQDVDADADASLWVLGMSGPTEADATLFGFIASCMTCDADPDSRRVIECFPVLMDYAKRIHDKYFPDYEFWEPW